MHRHHQPDRCGDLAELLLLKYRILCFRYLAGRGGSDVCKDATQTIVDIRNATRPGNVRPIVCSGRARGATRSISSGGPAMHSSGWTYVIIGEKR